MSLIFATQLTAIATAVLALFAIITAYYARKAFLKQSQEIRDQAEMLRVQPEQLEEQRKINAEQTKVLQLQAAELNESLRERIRDTEERKSAQAAWIIASFALSPGRIWGALIHNSSDLPVLDVRTFFRYVAEKWDGGDWDPRMLGGPPERIRILQPQEERFIRIPENVSGQMTDISDSNYVVSIEFTDTAGNRWERDRAERSFSAPENGAKKPGHTRWPGFRTSGLLPVR